MLSKRKIPREFTIDNSINLLKEGYLFIHNRCLRYKTNMFITRLMAEKVICMSGKEAAELFYDKDKFQRKGAAPKRIQKSLFGENGVQTLDGNEHLHRKQMFMSLMTPEKLEEVVHLTKEKWDALILKWESLNEVNLFESMQMLLFQVGCEWAGVPFLMSEVYPRAKDFTAMVDAFGAIGPRHWSGRLARTRQEKWIMNVVEGIREGSLLVKEGTAAELFSLSKDVNGDLLSPHVAAVEIINIIRPIVAISYYITFSALALYHFPECKTKIQNYEEDYIHMFCQEVRRFYPFGPFLGARVKKDFIWNGQPFHKGTLILLDIYGTNHDEHLWENADQFTPERFKHWNGDPFALIPQGGGDHYTHHRCAGEWLTVDVMKTSINYLVHAIDYEIPLQDLSFTLNRMPAIPKSGVILRNVKRKS